MRKYCGEQQDKKQWKTMIAYFHKRYGTWTMIANMIAKTTFSKTSAL